jgi:hypothetical protein
MDDDLDDIRTKLSDLEARHADELDRADARFTLVTDEAMNRWRDWWQDNSATNAPTVEQRLRRKFTLCFPLAAHTLNHVEAAIEARPRRPWLAKSCARIAFEHSLTAQWVLLTADGEDRLKSKFDLRDYKRREQLVRGVRNVGLDDLGFADGAYGLTENELQKLIGDRPASAGPPNLEGMCRRFAGGGAEDLFYDIQRDLSEAIYPSLGLLRAYLTLNADGTMRGVDPHGTGSVVGASPRDLAFSALWALYTLEVCRAGQPNAAEVNGLGAAIGLPVDLRGSDQEPNKQPVNESAYWHRSGLN